MHKYFTFTVHVSMPIEGLPRDQGVSDRNKDGTVPDVATGDIPVSDVPSVSKPASPVKDDAQSDTKTLQGCIIYSNPIEYLIA